MQEAWAGGLPHAPGRTARGDFATGAFFSLANPFALAFWSGMGGGMAALGGSRPGSFVTLFAGFVLGATLWCLCIPVVIGWGRRLVRPMLFRAINALCGVALGYFGGLLLWNTLHDVVGRSIAAASSDA